MKSVEIPLGDPSHNKTIVIETGKIAKQAHGSVWVRQGGSVVLTAAVADIKGREGIDFFPLTVDYRERMYASGKIPQIYGRREPRPGVDETLTARLIDHCIRPRFPKGFRNETQVQTLVVSADLVHPANNLALIGSSAALSISDIPFNGPIGGLTVARVRGEWIALPTYEEIEEADLELLVTGAKTGIMSVEGSAHEADEETIVEALAFAQEQIQTIIEAQEQLVAEAGKPKRETAPKSESEKLKARIRELAAARIRDSIGMEALDEREAYLDEVREEIAGEISEEFAEEFVDDEDAFHEQTADAFRLVEKEEMRRSILEEGRRLDGRAVDELRKIDCDIGILPRAHGSALFTRGQTQSLAAVTLGTALDANTSRGLRGETTQRFFLHYNFPSYSVGEVRRITGPGRREIGHGALAEKAIAPLIPSAEDFPYTIRAVSEITESSASSSMASVCSACLALMDAGVPLHKPVAGVGVGLIKDGDQESILTDMIGEEDFLGDMDFKVAGTADGVTAIQLDIKIDGVSIELMARALQQAKEARLRVLELMTAAIAEPRADLAPHAPRIQITQIDPERIGELIGPGGKVIRGLQDEFGVTINVEEDGTVQVATADGEAADKALQAIADLFYEAQPGDEITGKVTRVAPFGAFVSVKPGQDGLIHISDLASGYLRRVEDVVNVGDEIAVRVTKVDDRGRVDLEPIVKFEGSEEEPEERRGSGPYRKTGGGSSESRRGSGPYRKQSSERRGSGPYRKSSDRRSNRDNDERSAPRVPKARF